MIELRFGKGDKVRIKNHEEPALIGLFGTVKKFAECGGPYNRTPRYVVMLPSTDPTTPAEITVDDDQLDPV